MGIGSSSGAGYSYTAVAQWLADGSRNFGRAGFERASARFAPLPPSLAGLSFIVTGANSGLGFATALALARLRADVHLVCRSRARGEEALRSIRAAPQCAEARLSLHVCDFSSAQQVKDFASAWEQRGAPLHGLVLNAGFIAPTHALTPGPGDRMTAACPGCGVARRNTRSRRGRARSGSA